MKISKTRTAAPKYSVSHCNFHNDVFVVNEHAAKAIQALAEACVANAKAIQEAASRLAGPANNGVMLKIGD
jgi:hypothetical protein